MMSLLHLVGIFLCFCCPWPSNRKISVAFKSQGLDFPRQFSVLNAVKRERKPTTPESSWTVQAVGKIQTCYLQKHVIPRQATISQQKVNLLFTEKHKKTLSVSELAELNVTTTAESLPSLDQVKEDEINRLLQYEAYNLTYLQEIHQLFSPSSSLSHPLPLTSTDITEMIDQNHPLLSIGKIVVFDEYKDCIRDLEGFDYLWLITVMHVNKGYKKMIRPRVNPQLQPQEQFANSKKKSEDRVPGLVGLFSSRAPHRPNPIALSALSILHVDHSEGVIYVQGSDLLNDTPILDIKPYLPAFDSFPEARAGWMDLISPNRTEARLHGYQQIYSARGARATRAGIRRKLLLSSVLEEEGEKV